MKTVVFLTNCESGQCNVHVATASSILLQHENVNVHFISFIDITDTIRSTEHLLASISGRPKTIHLHVLPGFTHAQAIICQFPFQPDVSHGWGFWEALRFYKTLPHMVMSLDGPEYVNHFKNTVTALQSIFATAGGKDDVVCVVDTLFLPAMDAVRHLGATLCLLSPNTLKELILPLQPYGAMLWKYPA